MSADQNSAAVQPIKVLLVEPQEGQKSYLRDLLDEHYEVTFESTPLRAWDRLVMGHQADILLMSTDGDRSQVSQLLTWIRDGKLKTDIPLWTFALGPEQPISSVLPLADPQRHISGPHLLTHLSKVLRIPEPYIEEVPQPQVVSIAESASQSVPSPKLSAVRIWLDTQAPSTGKMLFAGQVNWHVENEQGALRPARYGLLRRMLREQDGMLCENDRQFWLLLDMKDELRAARVALRMAVALTRSSDPGSFPLSMSLGGCYVNGNEEQAVQMCERGLVENPFAGQIHVNVDRWHFSLPIRVAQTLINSD